MSVISFLLPKDEAEDNKNDITQVQKFSWLLSQYTMRNQLPVIKQPASTIVRNMMLFLIMIMIMIII